MSPSEDFGSTTPPAVLEMPRDDADPDALAERPPLPQLLDEIPLHIAVWHEVDLDSEDPAFHEALSRRVCIATRKAGGRCTVGAMGDSLLCAAHSGRLDPVAGGQAKARKSREARISAEERVRLARLGTRGVIAQALEEKQGEIRLALHTLADAAAEGDVAAAKLLIPYLNQGLGMPTEVVRTHVVDEGTDVRGLPTSALLDIVRERRSRAPLRAAEPDQA